MNQFKSKYPIGALIEYKQDRNDGDTLFGKIVSVTFWKSDSVNYATSYNIETVNNSDSIDRGIHEMNVVREFKEV